MAADEQPAEPPKKRALPFKRTVARKQQRSAPPPKTDDDSDLDLFRHSKEVFPEILREAQETETLKQHDRKRRKLSADGSPDRASPRRRSTTLDHSDDDLITDVKGKGKEVINPRRRTPNPGTPPSKRSIPSTRAHSAAPNTAVINLDSDEDEHIEAITTPHRRSSRRRTSERLTPRHDRNPSPSPSPSPPPEIVDPDGPAPAADQPADEFSQWIAKAREMQTASREQQQQSAVVKVLITSRLPNAAPRPVLARRRLNQDVQLLLRAWVAEQVRQGVAVPDDVAAGLFLTWRGRKIYGVSTLASLGVRVDEATGALLRLPAARSAGPKGGDNNDDDDDDDDDDDAASSSSSGYRRGVLHLEVWDEETYREYLESRARRRLDALDGYEEGRDGAGMDGEGADAEEGGDEEAARQRLAEQQQRQQKRKGVRIVLKAREHEPLKLTTREETTVEMIIEAFRVQRGVGPEWDVAVWFDGERLDEDAVVKDLDIDPDEANQMEVHVKRSEG